MGLPYGVAPDWSLCGTLSGTLSRATKVDQTKINQFDHRHSYANRDASLWRII